MVLGQYGNWTILTASSGCAASATCRNASVRSRPSTAARSGRRMRVRPTRRWSTPTTSCCSAGSPVSNSGPRSGVPLPGAATSRTACGGHDLPAPPVRVERRPRHVRARARAALRDAGISRCLGRRHGAQPEHLPGAARPRGRGRLRVDGDVRGRERPRAARRGAPTLTGLARPVAPSPVAAPGRAGGGSETHAHWALAHPWLIRALVSEAPTTGRPTFADTAARGSDDEVACVA